MKVQELLGRYLVPALLAVGIVLLFAIWQKLSSIDSTLYQYSCGTRSYPCRVVTQPDRP